MDLPPSPAQVVKESRCAQTVGLASLVKQTGHPDRVPEKRGSVPLAALPMQLLHLGARGERYRQATLLPGDVAPRRSSRRMGSRWIPLECLRQRPRDIASGS